jgi:hypothetical protein
MMTLAQDCSQLKPVDTLCMAPCMRHEVLRPWVSPVQVPAAAWGSAIVLCLFSRTFPQSSGKSLPDRRVCSLQRPPLGLEVKWGPEGRWVGCAIRPSPRPPEFPSPSTRGRHPLVRFSQALCLWILGLHPRFALVIYFWHTSLPSWSSKPQKKKNKIS